MTLEREIHALQAELYAKGDIPCHLAGRYVRESECSARSLDATAEEFRVCRACQRGQDLARTSGWPVQDLPPRAELPEWARPKAAPAAPYRFWAEAVGGSRAALVKEPVAPAGEPARPRLPRAPRTARPAPAVVVGVDHGKPGGDRTVEVTMAVRPEGLEVLAMREIPEALPQAPPADPRLIQLARTLLLLTRDGRLRVSMLDLMRALGLATYDEADALVRAAGLRTSQLCGPVRAVLVDHKMRALLESAPKGEWRQ